MIAGNIQIALENQDLSQSVRKALEYALNHDLESMTPGMHDIDGKNFYVNILQTETLPEDKRDFEAHRDYIDVHVDILGSERVDLGNIQDMKSGFYHPDTDYQEVSGVKSSSVYLCPGDFIACWPEDVHKTHVNVNPGISAPLKKAVFKVKL